MKSDAELRSYGFNVLFKALGPVEAERFLVLIHREGFDYTQWRQSQWQNDDVATLAVQAREARNQQP